MASNTNYLPVIPAAAAVLLYAYIGTINIPERNINSVKKGSNIMASMGNTTATKMPFEISDYQFIDENKKITEQINVIHNVLSILLEESQDLDPKYSKVVDKYFWDLV
ncbi:MAG: hypothetical protein PHP42_12525 [Bacteroidota bacterium]|jgi:hypothetical protein|nr:hypothetical protein [Bacteroidota bacterium]